MFYFCSLSTFPRWWDHIATLLDTAYPEVSFCSVHTGQSWGHVMSLKSLL